MGLFSSIGDAFSSIGSQLPVVGGLFSNFLSNQTAEINADSQEETNAVNENLAAASNATSISEANQNIALQKEFAQNGIQWRVADAAKVGISPLAAIGAAEPGFSPVMPVMDTPTLTAPQPGGSTNVADTLGGVFGQYLGRAAAAAQSPDDKASAALDLAYKSKENDLLDVQIANAKLNLMRQTGPGLPTGPSIMPASQTVMNADGTTSQIPTYNTHSSLFGPTLWSIDNQMIPQAQDLYTNLVSHGAYSGPSSDSVNENYR